jgi:hypothetical protein
VPSGFPGRPLRLRAAGQHLYWISLCRLHGQRSGVTVSITPVLATWNDPITYGAGQVSAGATLEADQYPDYPWFPTVGTVGTFSTT